MINPAARSSAAAMLDLLKKPLTNISMKSGYVSVATENAKAQKSFSQQRSVWCSIPRHAFFVVVITFFFLSLFPNVFLQLLNDQRAFAMFRDALLAKEEREIKG